jgi:preprotein translocase subunit SecE
VAGKSTSTKKNTKSKNTKPRHSQKGIAKWWRETMGELRKVTWPTPKDAWQLTKVVILVLVAMSVFLGLFDFLFSNLMGLILS